MSRRARYLAAILIVFVLDQCLWAASYKLKGFVTRSGDATGLVDMYELALSAMPGPPGAPFDAISFQAPDGTNFVRRATIGPAPFNQFLQQFAGTWTINETDSELGIVSYEFDMPAISPADFAEVPRILSPESSTTQPAEFDVAWQLDDQTTTGCGFQLDLTLAHEEFVAAFGETQFGDVFGFTCAADAQQARVVFNLLPNAPDVAASIRMLGSSNRKLAVLNPSNISPESNSFFSSGDLFFTTESAPLEVILSSVPDCNEDGQFDIEDTQCVTPSRLIELLDAAGLVLGDADADGRVGFSDFLLLNDHYGEPGTYQDGNFDLIGDVEFSDFLILSDTFGSIIGPSLPVPEPTHFTFALIGLLLALARHYRP